jgi:hypothetical protein
MKRLILLLALAMPSLAQTNQDPNERIQKLVTLKYADPRTLQNLLANFGVEIRADENMKVIALSGRRANVMTAEDAIKQLDVPSAEHRDIDLTVYFVVASDQNSTEGSPIPADLQSTVATLKTTFPFRNYSLLDVLSLQSRSGAGASTSGILSGNRITQFSVNSATVEPESMVRLDHLRAGLRTATPGGEGKISYIDTGITADVVDVKEGQKLVVGRSSVNGPDRALFLVLIAKPVE